MSKADFPQGIRGGMPPDTTVAEKFGERLFVKPDSTPLGNRVRQSVWRFVVRVTSIRPTCGANPT